MTTTTTHTPGPWRHQNGMIQCQGKWSDDAGEHFDWRYPRILAEVTDDWDQYVNARLIAAAPDLLAVAAMLDRIAGQVPFTGPFHDAIVAARAALSKAKGE